MTTDSVASTSLPHLTVPVLNHGMMEPSISIGQDGRIKIPGIGSGLSFASYLPMVHLYASILEASRILDRYRAHLSPLSGENFQAPLTPLVPSTIMPNLYYKREDQTVTRAYKVRGALVGMSKGMESQGATRFLVVSTGNHALGVLKAAELLRPESVCIVVPTNTALTKLKKIRKRVAFLQALGVKADLVHEGETFDDARAWAMAQSGDAYYLDPYSDPWVVAGQGTIGLELFHQLTPLLARHTLEEVVVIAPIGGGGLLAGTATALKMAAAWDPRFRSVDVHFLGLRLADFNARLGDAVRVHQVAPGNQALFDALSIPVLDMDDDTMLFGMKAVESDLGVQVEGPCGATLYPVRQLDAYQPTENRLVISLLSGGNVTLV